MATGYEDIDNLENQTNQLYEQQINQQNSIIDTSTQQITDEIERNKQKAEQEAEKTNRALYTDYQKQINPYGVNAEHLAEQGLANSGLAETTKAKYYNTYQTARTEATNNANIIKADFDAQITQARQNGDIQKAQSALEMYKQKISDLSNFYNLRFQVDQFNYNKERDTIADSQWEKEYQRALQEALWEQKFNQAQFDYQKQRDKVSDSQWEKEYQLSKKKATASSGSKLKNVISVNEPADKLSDYGNNFLKLAQTGLSKYEEDSTVYNTTLRYITNNMNTFYKDGKLTEADVRLISERLGI